MADKKTVIIAKVANFVSHTIKENQQLSLAFITSKCHISKKTIYKYFKNKDELIKTVFLYSSNELKSKINQSKASGIGEFQSIMEDLSKLLDAFGAFHRKELTLSNYFLRKQFEDIASFLSYKFFKNDDESSVALLEAYLYWMWNSIETNFKSSHTNIYFTYRNTYPTMLYKQCNKTT